MAAQCQGDTRQLPGDNVCPQLPPQSRPRSGPGPNSASHEAGSAPRRCPAHTQEAGAPRQPALRPPPPVAPARTACACASLSVSWRCTSWVAKAQAPAAAAQDSAPEGAWGGGDRGARRDMNYDLGTGISGSGHVSQAANGNAVSRGRARLVAHLCIFKNCF